MKAFVLSLILSLPVGMAWISDAPAAGFVPSALASPGSLYVAADWQEPEYLPRRFRNHCRFAPFVSRSYCSDHCGADYQFYYCSEISFGCCHLGHGYCDFFGFVRCSP
jgi:hypothetical protein